MIITKDVLKNLKLKFSCISEKRCQEINAMKIKNPYYPLPFFTCKWEYFTIQDSCFVHSEDERIVYMKAFAPLPVLKRESLDDYYDVFVLVIDDKYFSVVIDFTDHKKIYVENKYVDEVTGKLLDDVWLDKRSDRDEIIYLIGEMQMYGYGGIDYKNGRKILNLEYKGESYKWKHWNE